MTPDEVLSLAKAGNPKILSAIINRSTKPHGFKVRVAQRDECLYFLLEGKAIGNSASLVTFIRGSLQKLKVNPEFSVKIYGRQLGHNSIAWSRGITIHDSMINTSDTLLQQDKAANVSSTIASDLSESTVQFSNQQHDTPLDSSIPDTPQRNSDGYLESDEWQPASPAPKLGSSGESIEISEHVSPGQQREYNFQETTINSSLKEFAPVTEPNKMGAFTFVQPTDDIADKTPDVFMDDDMTSVVDTPASESTTSEEETDSESFQAMMQRPEALVIILFAIVLYIWQLYNALAQAAAPEGSVTTQELATRLGVSRSTIIRRKFEEDFASWSSELDPDGIAWMYSEGSYVPQMPDFNLG